MENKNRITVTQLAIMTTVAVASLRSLPAMATAGWSSITQWLIPAIMFFVPTALVGAELGTKFKGGVFEWVKEAYGERLGFLAVWLQWIQNVVWYPTQLAMVAGTFAYFIGMDSLSNSGVYTGAVILIVYWGATFITLSGGNFFARVASTLGLIGTLIPALLLIVMGGVWLMTGHPVSEILTHSDLLHKANVVASGKVSGMTSPQWMLVVSNVLAFAGMEINAIHVKNLDNPKSFSRVMVITFVLVMGIFILPTLVLSMTTPAAMTVTSAYQTTGVMVAFENIFVTTFGSGAGIIANVIALAVVLGATASIIAWLAGPSRGVADAGRTGLLPVMFQKENSKGVQSGILIPQGIFVTALAALYIIFKSSVSAVFLAITGFAAALYVIMYIIMFFAAMKLRREGKGLTEGYKAPALFFVSWLGIIGCAFGLVMSFVPVSNAAFPAVIYPFVVLGVIIVLGVWPLIFATVKKPEWNIQKGNETFTKE